MSFISENEENRPPTSATRVAEDAENEENRPSGATLQSQADKQNIWRELDSGVRLMTLQQIRASRSRRPHLHILQKGGEAEETLLVPDSASSTTSLPFFLKKRTKDIKIKLLPNIRPYWMMIATMALTLTVVLLDFLMLRKYDDFYSHKQAAAICAVQKWGLLYIDEWIDYHIALGFQTIFIYDNSDDFELKDWFSKKYPNGTDRVKIFHWPGLGQQMPSYNKCIRDIQQQQSHSWIAFIDIDEFLVIKDTSKYPFIMDLLNSIPRYVGGLAVTWQMFDWNNQTRYEAQPLSLRFNRFTKNLHVKTVARTNRLRDKMENAHYVEYVNKTFKTVDTNGDIVEGPFNERMPTNVLAVNHFAHKSLEEYKLRCVRGRADMNIIQNAQTYLPCKTEEEIVATWMKNDRDAASLFDFDDSVWKLLKERVPTYSKYETETDASLQQQFDRYSKAACDVGYLRLYPDVAKVVEDGRLDSGFQHWVMHGKSEGYKPYCQNWFN